MKTNYHIKTIIRSAALKKEKRLSRKYILLILIALSINVYGQNRLLIPDTLSGSSFELNLQKGSMQFYDGQKTNTMGANGNILGPTLIMRKGDYVDIVVNNNIEETTTIHWHGMHVSAANDGGPHTTIAPGNSWNPKFTVMDKAATYWYHPHLHEKTNKHVSLGIAGFIIVRDDEEAALELPRTYGVDDFPLVIQTKEFDANNQVVIPTNSDDVPMVNATINPFLDVPAQIVRFRLLNGSSQRVFNIGLSGNEVFYQIGSDGGLFEAPVPLTRLQMAPGERAEILVDLKGLENQQINLMSFASELPNGIYGADQPGTSFMMTLNGYNPNPLNGTNFDLLMLNVKEPTSSSINEIPEKLATVIPLIESAASTTRNIYFNPAQMGPNQLNGNFLINGLHFDMDIINFSIPLDNIEVWSLTNQSAIAHPFHIHDIQFFVLDRNGVTPALSEQGRKDVILVKPMETVRFITQFTDFANDPVPYMLHCHMLTHEDMGMMLQFEVVEQVTGTNQINLAEKKLKIYPNPVTRESDKITVEGVENGLLHYELYNMNGQLMYKNRTETVRKQLQIDINDLSKGKYVVKVIGKTKTVIGEFIVW